MEVQNDKGEEEPFREREKDGMDGASFVVTDPESGEVLYSGGSTYAIEYWAEPEGTKAEQVVSVSLPFDREHPIVDRVEQIANRIREIRKQRREAFFRDFVTGRDLDRPAAVQEWMADADLEKLRPFCHYSEGLMHRCMTHDPDDDPEDCEYDFDSFREFLGPVYEAEARCLRRLAAGGEASLSDFVIPGHEHEAEQLGWMYVRSAPLTKLASIHSLAIRSR